MSGFYSCHFHVKFVFLRCVRIVIYAITLIIPVIKKQNKRLKYWLLDEITHDDIVSPTVTSRHTSAPTSGKTYHVSSDDKLLMNTITVVTSKFTNVNALVNLAPRYLSSAYLPVSHTAWLYEGIGKLYISCCCLVTLLHYDLDLRYSIQSKTSDDIKFST